MADNIIQSYLVGLGFEVSQPQLRQFQSALVEAERGVQKQTAGMAHQLLGWQAAITGAFVAIGGAAIGLIDKVAMADQEYRLFALRMYMSTGAARSLKIALDSLGQPLDAIAWDPELHGRFVQLLEDQQVMAKSLGVDYEAQMRRVRDLRFEVTRFGVELKYLAMQFAGSLFKKLGIDANDLLARLRQWNDWIIGHLPQIAEFFADKILPVFAILRNILSDTWGVVKELGVAFANLIGLLSGDDSLEGTEFSFQKISKAIEQVVGWVGYFIHAIIQAENVLLHFVNAALLASSGKWADASKEMQAGMQNLSPGAGAVIGAPIGSTVGGMIGGALGAEGGPLGIAAGASLGSVLGGLLGGGAGAAAGSANQSPGNTADLARELAKQVSASTGVPANIIWSQWAHETGGFSNRGATSLNNLAGIRYPGTNVYRSFDSLADFGSYYQQLIRGKRYADQGALKARTDEDFAGALKRGGYYEDSQANYQRGMRSFEPEYARSGANTTTVGDVHVNVMQPNATPTQISHAVKQGIHEAMSRQNQRDMAEAAGNY